MIAWLLLLSLLSKSTQDQQGEENGVSHCEPQNLNLTSSDQMLMLTWEDDPLCSRGVLIYEFVVLIADKAVHSEEVAVEPAQIRSRHSWNWTSHLPLECAFHSVRLRSQYGNYTSQWKEERIRKQSGGFRVFPRNKVLEVGTNATFCCIVSPNEEFYFMNLGKYRGTNNITTKISEDVYALTLHLSQPPSHTSTDVYCNIKGQGHNGASNFIGYPPRAYDLQCETRDLKSVECMWKEKKTYLTNKHPTTYWLGGRKCQPVVYSCSQPFAGEKNWTLTAENVLGKVELQDRADLKERVHMFAPEELTALTVNARNVSLKWKWTEKHYSSLNITCLINVSDGETHNIRSISGAGLNAAPINNLTPNWRHSVKVQCGTAQHFWKWGDWSKTLEIHTKADVPDALDVWMMMKEDHTVVIWKTERVLCPLPLDENPHSEEDITVIPELLYIYNKEAPAHVQPGLPAFRYNSDLQWFLQQAAIAPQSTH
ncbi:oncostatin-M-specific receptor subunit beta-like isoform 2-T2 [Pholidichthys leucotaenia]